jgi:hypothetical protein
MNLILPSAPATVVTGQNPPYTLQQMAPLFDHLVGTAEQCNRYGEPDRLGGLEIDDQLEFGYLHDRQVAGLFPLKNSAHAPSPLNHDRR